MTTISASTAPDAATPVGRAIEHVRTYSGPWSQRSVDDRGRVLQAWRTELELRREDLITGLSAATGRCELSEMELDSVLANIDRCVRWGSELMKSPATQTTSDPGVTMTKAPVPLGVVGVISPWNFPLQLALIDAVPALVAGCTVVVKPSELTPDFVPVLQETVAAVPELGEALVVVEGGPDAGREVVEGVDVVCFTGSVRTGRAVASAAAARFIPAFLELGGKDPAIVMTGADLDVASSGILWGSTANTGQSCMSLERIYVESAVADEFIDLLRTKAESVSVAYEGPGSGDIGRFIDPRQARVVQAHVDDAVAKGATVVTGGAVEERNGAYFLRPTVLTGVTHDMDVMTEETFGPVIPVMVVDSVEEAVRLANATEYGLSAAVFGPDEAARGVAARVLAGGVSVNDVLLTGMVPEGEKQAFKSSGLGPSRMGPESVLRFLRKRVLLVRETAQVQLWWYPVDADRG